MQPLRTLPRLAAALLALASTLALAQAPRTYQPSVGQPGRDVVWVPTSQALVNKMLDLAQVTPADYVMDLGSGDGRTVITAAKRGAQALGIEYNPDMVTLSRRLAEEEGVTKRAQFLKADLFKTDLRPATVISMFLLPDINLKLRPEILKLRPGTRVVSNTFDMGDWEPDEVAKLGDETGCDSWCTALLWIVPARAEGRHQLPQGEFTFKQEFQMLSGTLRRDGKTFALEGRVRGEDVAFHAGGRQYRGRMRDGKLVLN